MPEDLQYRSLIAICDTPFLVEEARKLANNMAKYEMDACANLIRELCDRLEQLREA